MKWICTILALIVLILSVQPVCMATTEDTCCAAAMTCTAADGQEDQPADDDDSCSGGCNPFQLCACCAFSAITAQHPEWTAPGAFRSALTHQGIPAARFSEGPVAGFWQPPRTI